MSSTSRTNDKPVRWETTPEAPAPGDRGWLEHFDLFVIQTSGGKDSQTALRRAALVFEAAGVMSRTYVQHNNLGERVEWPQVPELAAEQARRAGIPVLEVTARPGVDLLDDVATRRKRTDEDKALRRPASGDLRGWPGAGLRYCTSDHKTTVSRHFIEALCAQRREQLGRPVRVLQVFGFRAQESRHRAGLEPYAFNTRQSAASKRLVWDWLPIHGMTTTQVWDDIRTSGVPYHPVYDEGMTRLSCRFCVLAGRKDLAVARRLSPEVAEQYVSVEQAIGHTFQPGRPLASIEPQPGRQGFAVRWLTCPTCSVPVLARDWETTRHCPAHADTGPWATAHAAADAEEADGWTQLAIACGGIA